MLESINAGVMVENENRGIVFVNRAFLDMFGIGMSVDDFMSVSSETVVRAAKSVFADGDYFIDRKESVAAARETVLNEEFVLRDGRVFERDYYPVFNEDIYMGHAWIYRDVSDRKDLENKLFELAVTDELTQAYNRRKLNEELRRSMDMAKRFGTYFSVILINLDSLRSINEEYGNDAGDEVLASVAGAVLAGKRRVDIFGRWDGAAFLLLLPGTDVSAAELLAERLHYKLSQVKYSLFPGTVAISMGVAQFRDTEEDNALIKRADEALCRARDQEGSRICRAL